jgi:hypothetical protein
LTEKTHRPIYDEVVGKRWKQSLQRCGIKHRRLYSQRHSFLSHALVSRVNQVDVWRQSG